MQTADSTFLAHAAVGAHTPRRCRVTQPALTPWTYAALGALVDNATAAIGLTAAHAQLELAGRILFNPLEDGQWTHQQAVDFCRQLGAATTHTMPVDASGDMPAFASVSAHLDNGLRVTIYAHPEVTA